MIHTLFLIVIAVHVLAGVFWAGSTFVGARIPTVVTPTLRRAQLGSALVSVVAGAVLWNLAQIPLASLSSHILGIGAACAILAAPVQAFLGQRPAAVLLALTVVSMVIARYA